MNAHIKRAWLEALRNGEYKQGFGKLRHNNDTYCCLGVLCDIYSKIKHIPWTKDECGTYCYLTSYGVLPENVYVWAELQEENPFICENSLTGYNDGVMTEQKTFIEIADLIEQYL